MKTRKPTGKAARPQKSRSPTKRTQRAQKSKAFRKERARKIEKRGPRPSRPPRPPRGAPPGAAPPSRPDTSRPRALQIARAGLDKKAEEVVVLDLRAPTRYAAYYVLMTADSERHAGPIADHVDETLKAP